ncbi:MAG: nucleotidyltransferase family protein [Deltaproteobacteria bacterium]|nr:nucleotidyltransferase family protein [Deltaproteobacteria bacterium]
MAVAAILLAAGSATRMGRNKVLLPLGGESVLRRAARTALSAGLDPVLVVLGHEADRAEAELAGLPVRAVRNPRHRLGINTSLSAGAEAVPEGAEAVVVLLADMPGVEAALIRQVVSRYQETRAPLVTALYGEIPAPPTLYDRSLLPELRGGEGEGRGRELVRRHWGRAEKVACPESALADLDVPADYERARSRLGEGDGR